MNSDIRARVLELQRASQALELDVAARRVQLDEVTAYAEAYLARLADGPVYSPVESSGARAAALSLSEEPVALDAALAALAEHVDADGLRIGSSRFFGFIPSGGLYTAALGDYLAAVTNRYAGVQFAAPGVTELERGLVRWFADVVGYPQGAEGDLTSGGSIATLSAMIAAREAAGMRSREVHRAVVYLTAHTHHCVHKALRIAGMGECVFREVAIDDAYRMRVDALEQAIEEDRAAGRVPWLIVATAGSTDLGSVDPLPALARLAKANEVWLHVDAAYGGAFALCELGRERLAGMEQSDSLIMDPHKGLFLPFGTGLVLVRNGDWLRRAFSADAPYMQDRLEAMPGEERSAFDLSPELTRPFRGLRMWLPLKIAGLQAFRAALEEKLLLARYFYHRLQALDEFEVGPPPDLSIVTFRYRAGRGDQTAANKRLVENIRNDGRIFITSTTVHGEYILRMAVLSYNTHLDDIETAIDLLREFGHGLEQ